MARRKTNEEWVKEVFSLVGDEYIPIDTYINTNTKIAIKHVGCGKV